jgi:integrase
VRGSITRRGKSSWRIKYDLPPVDGKRQTRVVTIRGTRQVAQRELTKLLRERDTGVAIDPSTITVSAYLQAWLWEGATDLAPKTLERYQQLASQQIIPHIGDVALQKLRPADIKKWHADLLATGLAARTVGHAHRVLHKAVADALAVELVSRNVAAAISPPKVEHTELEILTTGQIREVADALADHWMYMALGTGARRGELLALRWSDIAGRSVTIDRSLEQTKDGLRFKAPKTLYGRRTVILPPWASAALRAFRAKQLKHPLPLGQGGRSSSSVTSSTYLYRRTISAAIGAGSVSARSYRASKWARKISRVRITLRMLGDNARSGKVPLV